MITTAHSLDLISFLFCCCSLSSYECVCVCFFLLSLAVYVRSGWVRMVRFQFIFVFSFFMKSIILIEYIFIDFLWCVNWHDHKFMNTKKRIVRRTNTSSDCTIASGRFLLWKQYRGIVDDRRPTGAAHRQHTKEKDNFSSNLINAKRFELWCIGLAGQTICCLAATRRLFDARNLFLLCEIDCARDWPGAERW